MLSPPPVTLILLPGLDGTGKLFEPFVEALPDTIRSVVVNYPVDQPLGYAELELIAAAAIPESGPFLILGESFSGPLALRLAARHPVGLAGVILVGSFVRSPVPRWLVKLRFLPLAILARLPPPRLVIRWILAGRSASVELVSALRLAIRNVLPKVLVHRLRAVLEVDAAAYLRDCHAPVLALIGRRDRLVRAGSVAAMQSIRPDLQVAHLDAPHLILQTEPVAAARIVTGFAWALA